MEPDSVTSCIMIILFMDWYANHFNEVNRFSALDNMFKGDSVRTDILISRRIIQNNKKLYVFKLVIICTF